MQESLNGDWSRWLICCTNTNTAIDIHVCFEYLQVLSFVNYHHPRGLRVPSICVASLCTINYSPPTVHMYGNSFSIQTESNFVRTALKTFAKETIKWEDICNKSFSIMIYGRIYAKWIIYLIKINSILS